MIAKKVLTGSLLHNEPMTKYTSWRVGGPAQRYYRPQNLADLAAFMQTVSPLEPLLWLGLGSNLLVRDGGIIGTVINTQGCLNELHAIDEFTVRAEAGVSCAQLARYCARLNLQGAEFWAGIPGTVGGAIAMNAGCFDGETWKYVHSVECMNRHGEIICRFPEEYQVGYRSVKGPKDEWFVAGYFQLTQGIKEKSLALIRHYLQHRAATQPTSEPNCGSVFRNPLGDYAGRLIESCGLKGLRVGNAAVSEKHANFIVNLGGATAQDIESLLVLIQERVHQQHGVELICEVHIVGERVG